MLLPDSLTALEYPPWLSPWPGYQSRGPGRQDFAAPDDQCATGQEASQQALQDFLLRAFVKIREHQIAAQDQVKMRVRQCRAHILLYELDPLTVFRAQTVSTRHGLKGLGVPRFGQQLETAGGIAGLARALKQFR